MHTIGAGRGWEDRFRAASVLWSQTAPLDPGRGLICSDKDGVMQLYGWEIDSGNLKQLTNLPAGVADGMLSADGEHVYYLQDEGGNEIGHFVRVPFAGGPPEDVTPDLPPYSPVQISQSSSGNIIGAQVAEPDGHKLYLWAAGSKPRQIHNSQLPAFGPVHLLRRGNRRHCHHEKR